MVHPRITLPKTRLRTPMRALDRCPIHAPDAHFAPSSSPRAGHPGRGTLCAACACSRRSQYVLTCCGLCEITGCKKQLGPGIILHLAPCILRLCSSSAIRRPENGHEVHHSAVLCPKKQTSSQGIPWLSCHSGRAASRKSRGKGPCEGSAGRPFTSRLA